MNRSTIGLLAGALLLSSAAADAALKLRLDDGVSGVLTIADGDGNDTTHGTNGAPPGPDGVVNYGGAYGAFGVNVNVGSSKPVLGSSTQPHMDLLNLQIGGAGDLTVSLTDTDFDLANLAPTSAGFLAAVGGTTNGTVQLSYYLDNSNAEFGVSAANEIFATPVFGGPAFSTASFSQQLVNSGPFSLTIVAKVSHAAASQITSFDAELQIPEPGSLAILGGGLLALGLMRRRRQAAA